MRRIYLLTIGLATLLSRALPATAQELTLMGVPPGRAQIVPMTGLGYYILYRSEAGEEGRDIHALRLLDPALKVRREYTLDLPTNAQLKESFSGRTVLGLVYQAPGKLLFHTFNPQTGAHLENELSLAARSPRQPGGEQVVGTPAEGYCVVQHFSSRGKADPGKASEDTAGFQITMVDAALRTTATRMHFPTKAHRQGLSHVAVSKSLIAAILYDSYYVDFGTKEQRQVTDSYAVGFDPATGKELYRVPLRQNNQSAVPDRLVPLADGRVAASGRYVLHQAPRQDSVLGVFVTTYRPAATQDAPTLLPWAELGKVVNVPDLGRALYEHKAGFQLIDHVAPGGNEARVIAEFRSGSEPLRYVVLPFDAAAKLGTPYLITRPFKAGSDAARTSSSAQMLVDRDGAPALLYTASEGGTQYVYTTPLADTPSRTAQRAPVALDPLPAPPAPPPMPSDPVSSGLGAFSQRMKTIDRAMGNTPAPTSRSNNPAGELGFVGATGKAIVVYRYEPLHKQLRLVVRDVE